MAEKNRVGFIGISESGRLGAIENTGNFLHGYAARKIVSDFENVYGFSKTEEELDGLRGRLSHLGFIAATTIPVNREPDFSKRHYEMAAFIENLRLPVVVFGLGAQAPLNTSIQDCWVPEGTKRLLKVLSARSETIAVRGDFTADLMKSMGIRNVEVIGCQSTFLSRRPDFKFPEVSPVIPDTSPERIVVTLTRLAAEFNLVAEAMAGKATHIGQSAHFEYRLKNIPEGVLLADLPDDVSQRMTPDHIKLFADGRLNFAEYHKWVIKKFEQFYSMPEWFEFLKGRFDLAIGTRFHGNMAAMLSGIPALWIVHDSRTQEFCDHLGLPNAPLAKIREGVPMRELVAQHLDPSRFNQVYPENYARFHAYLERQGVAHQLAAPKGSPS